MTIPSLKEEEIGKAVVNSAYNVHKALGPGLLERVYEICLAHDLEKQGLKVARQVDIPVVYDNIVFQEGFRLDLLVEDAVIIEVKSVLEIHPVWKAQVISHLKLTGKNLGYLINFNEALIKNGIKRFIRKD